MQSETKTKDSISFEDFKTEVLADFKNSRYQPGM